MLCLLWYFNDYLCEDVAELNSLAMNIAHFVLLKLCPFTIFLRFLHNKNCPFQLLIIKKLFFMMSCHPEQFCCGAVFLHLIFLFLPMKKISSIWWVRSYQFAEFQ